MKIKNEIEKKGKEKLQFEFSAEAVRRLDELKDRLDGTSRAEVVRNSLRLYEWIYNLLEAGYILELREARPGESVITGPGGLIFPLVSRPSTTFGEASNVGLEMKEFSL